MPIRLPGNLPAVDVLAKENVFVMSDQRAQHQDIRPMRILLLNLMPKKIETEIHIIRMLSNTPLQIDLELMRIHDKPSKSTSIEHMTQFYKSFEEVRHNKYDGFIVTGAPLGGVPFEEVTFWDEMKMVMDWSVNNVTSTFFLCWAVQAAMYHFYGIEKYLLPKKLSGVYKHRVINSIASIARGFDDVFDAPHSRYGEIRKQDIEKHAELSVIAESDIAGAYLYVRKDGRQLFVTGHAEYEPQILKNEYERDVAAGLNPTLPENYFPDNDPTRDPIVTWKSHGNLMFSNWLNYYVYQLTPFDMAEIGKRVTESPLAQSLAK